jgi:hypothetical protein
MLTIRHSLWASPIFCVEKNKDIRICPEFKHTVNKAIDVDKYPLPIIDDIYQAHTNNRKSQFFTPNIRFFLHDLFEFHVFGLS